MCCCDNKLVRAGWILGVGVALIAVGVGVGWGVIPMVATNIISQEKALVPGTAVWESWINVPIPMISKVYLMSVENTEEVMKGAKPIIGQKGPYVYEVYKEKNVLNVSDDGTEVTYEQFTYFFFNQTLSGDLQESDPVTMVNAALMGAILNTDMIGNAQIQRIVTDAAEKVFPDSPDTIFATKTAKEWLFDGLRLHCKDARPIGSAWKLFCNGMANKVKQGIEAIRPDPDPEHEGDFLYSYLEAKQNKSAGYYTIYTGVDDIKKLGTVIKFGKKLDEMSDILTIWPGPECNRVIGLDGSVFPPFMTTDTRINLFGGDICRTLSAEFDKEIEYEGVPGLRYIFSKNQLDNAEKSPENYCYCAGLSGCMRSGTLNLTPCKDAPIVFSLPHFYLTDGYVDMVEGLNPNEEDHMIFMEIEPTVGAPLRVAKRAMISMMIKPLQGNKYTEELPSALIPLIWLDDGINLNEENVDKLKTKLLQTFSLLDKLRWVIVGVGIAVTVVGIIFMLVALFAYFYL